MPKEFLSLQLHQKMFFLVLIVIHQQDFMGMVKLNGHLVQAEINLLLQDDMMKPVKSLGQLIQIFIRLI
jgi:hypothetical protein